MKCQVCGFESNDLDEICYYSINGKEYSSETDIENNLQNPDALSYILCNDCVEEFEFDNITIK